MSIIGIAATAKNFAIGKDGKLPWHYSADLRFFKETTIGNAVVMGMHTWRSIGKPLPKRLNIILSRTAQIEDQTDVLLARSKEEVLQLSNDLDRNLFIIGGAKTFETFANVIEKWIVTEIPVTVEDADVFMPRDFLEEFELAETKQLGEDLCVKIFVRKEF
jgi:dihydrofolate reductase